MKILHQREKQDLARILSHNGEDRTSELMNVLDAFLANENHQTVSDVHRQLSGRGMEYTQEFVEEALELFCNYGFAQVKTFRGREPLYEHRHLGQHHDHLICTRCGKVDEFINPMIEELQNAAAGEKGFAPLDHRLEIYGLCRNCAHVPGQAVALSEAEKGERLVVCGHGGGEELDRRLNDMGLTQGCEIEVLGSGDGPIVVACRGSRLALGRGMCEKVLVAPCPKGNRTPWRRRHKAGGWRRFNWLGRHRQGD